MATPIIVEIPHRLGPGEARRRLDQGFSRLAEQIGGPVLGRVDRAWDGDRMTFSVSILGQVITGQLQVLETLVRVEVLLPGFLGSLAAVIQGRLRTEGQALLERK